MLLVEIVKQSFLLTAGALTGMLYVILIPYVWIVAGLVVLAKAPVKRLVSVAERNAGFGWRPLQGYMTGRKEKKGARDTTKK